uniref:Uncharacterized protein n=1 Tax=Arundo donax TaxID=35708 RepID=A0A0A9A6F2_ARUDO
MKLTASFSSCSELVSGMPRRAPSTASPNSCSSRPRTPPPAGRGARYGRAAMPAGTRNAAAPTGGRGAVAPAGDRGATAPARGARPTRVRWPAPAARPARTPWPRPAPSSSSSPNAHGQRLRGAPLHSRVRRQDPPQTESAQGRLCRRRPPWPRS